MSFPKFKAVTTVLEPGESSSTTGLPVPVLEGEYYRYKLNMRNSQVYTPGEPAAGLKLNPVFYDILPYEGDTKITGSESGGKWSAPGRGSKWNPWLEPEQENFTLRATSNADDQGTVDDKFEIVFPEEDYKIWVGPVEVSRDGGGQITDLKPAGLESIYSVETRSRIKDSEDNFFQALGLSALDEEPTLNWTVTGLEEADVKKHHVTLQELKEYRENSGMTQAQYEEIRKGMRDIAVTFNNWEGQKDELYRMYASSDFWLVYEVETPLNLPVYSADRATVSDEALKTQIGRYKAGNSFVGTAKDVYTAESAVLEVYVHNPADRTQIGDYVWLDTNLNGMQDEIIYEVPETGTDFSRKLPKRVKEVDEYGNITYVPDWGKNGDQLKPDPGINGVRVELLNGLGQPCNYDGEAVEAEPTAGVDKFGRPLYYKLDENGDPLLDGSMTSSATTPYGPLSCITKSDRYGNQGYYIFPNLKDGEYRLRFTMPEEYNEYGLTTWEIGNEDDLVTMEVVEPGETWSPGNSNSAVGTFTAQNLTFVTADKIHADSKSKDEERVSYDVGVGLPVRYGGVTWLDEQEDGLAEHGYDGYYDNVENPHPDHQTDSYTEAGFSHSYENADGTKYGEGVTVVACIKGEERDEQGNIVPAIDMHGKPMITRPLPGRSTTRTMEILKEEYERLKAEDEAIRAAGGTESELTRLRTAYDELHRKYPSRYPELPAIDATPDEAELEAIFEPFVGTYEFKYMVPGQQYVFYAIPPAEQGTGKKIYKMSKTIAGDPLASWYENTGRYNGWTKEFTAEIPMDNGQELVVKNQAGRVLRYQDQRVIDFGLVAVDNTMISGIVWDDSTDREVLPNGSYAPYDGVRRDGYEGIGDVTVDLYAYGWVEDKGWWPLEKEDGELKFVDDLTAATPSEAKPMESTVTTAGGEWQFKLKPVLEAGDPGSKENYLVGYRVRIPEIPAAYTLTTMHRELDGVDEIEFVDSDLSGNTWLYARREPGQWLNLEKDVFDYTDPAAASIYLPYERAETDENGKPDPNLHTIRLGDVYYDYDAQRTIEHVDAGLVPYAKGSVNGIVWNDAQMVDGKAFYDGIRRPGEKGVEDVQVTLQYRIGDADYATKSEADYAEEPDTDYSRDENIIPDGTYVNLFRFDPDYYQPWADDTGEAYWISGNYILPRTLEAEERFLEDARTEEQRIDSLKRELEELIRQQASEVNELSGLQSKLGSAENAKMSCQAQLDEKYEKQSASEHERAEVEGRKARLEVLIEVRQQSIKELKDDLKQDHTQEEIEEINEKISKLETEKAGYEKEQREAEAAYQQLNTQIWEIGNEIRELQSKMESCELEISALKRQISLKQTDLEKLAEEIAGKRKESEMVYVGTANVRTDRDGCYAFESLPLFDEEQPVREGGKRREAFIQPEPYRYRILVEKASGLNFTYLKVRTAGANENNDSDVGILTRYDYENGNINRYGVGRTSLGVSDSFSLLEVMSADVNAYDGRFHLRQDRDVPDSVRAKRHALRDAGLLAFENRVVIGDYVWEDADGDGIQDENERGVKGAAVILFRYNPEGEETYYTYELVDKENVTATASNAVATPDSAHGALVASGTTKIRITGTAVRKGTWEPCADLDGVSLCYTDENGHYEFQVPVGDMSPESALNTVYRYRVQVYQPDGAETWRWAGIGRTKDEKLDSNVVPANAFMDLTRKTLDEQFAELLEGGSLPVGEELSVAGIYDPSDGENGRLSPVGAVNGMPAYGVYRAAVSAEFVIYDGKISEEPGWTIDLRKIRNDLNQDAGLTAPEKEKEPDKPDHGHTGGGGGGGSAVPNLPKIIEAIIRGEDPEDVPPLFTIPKTGVVPAGLTALGIAAAAGVVLLLTKRKKEDEE